VQYPGSSVDARRILIADSDGDSRTVYRIVLQHHGFDVVDVEDGATALTRARAGDVGLVVTELTLRVLDGHTLLEQLMSDEATAHIRVVVLTARALQEDRERATRAGCALFLTKPLQPMALLEKIRTIMERA
jgi:CheY-like chemotaxis protein